jgi:hypothetical protein
MTKPAKQIEQDLLDHACSQLAKSARQYVREGMQPAAAASRAIRDTKELFPPDWRLGVQGDDDEDEVEVWEVEHKRTIPCARIKSSDSAEADVRTGKLSGIGNIAGRAIAYVRWDDDPTGRPEAFTLREFQTTFGKSARKVAHNETIRKSS